MLHPSDFVKDRTYWAQHPRHGTFAAKLLITSDHSAAFRLDVAPGQIHPALLIMYEPRGYVCLFTGDVWTISDTNPNEPSHHHR